MKTLSLTNVSTFQPLFLLSLIRYFWDVVMSFSMELKKKLLLFATGSDRVPIGGMGEMEFKIIRMEVAHSTSM